MTNTPPRPSEPVRVGGVIYVVSKYGGGRMRIPVPVRHAAAVQELAGRRCASGMAVAVFRAVTAGRVLFASSYVRVTPAMDPAMSGIAVISRND
jgi:hypothetical protein